MTLHIELPNEYSDTNKPVKQDVVSHTDSGDWTSLNQVVVCQDSNGNVIAKFGECSWCITPYLMKNTKRNTFDFSAFSEAPQLTLELKLIVYGWLFHKSGTQSTPATASTLITRFSSLKTTYCFLLKHHHHSLSALSNPQIWQQFEAMLEMKKSAQKTLENVFIAINTALLLQSWLKQDFGVMKLQSISLAKKLSDRTSQQTFTIPERIADEIYAKAMSLVEDAYPHREKLAHLEQALQSNYLQGKTIVDGYIQSGKWQFLTNKSGEITDTQRYAVEINEAQPESMIDIIHHHLNDTGLLRDNTNGSGWLQYLGQLITASYICCGAFSGMRDSELDELSAKGYFQEEFNGTVFHMLQSKTFKLGEKRTTWVTAPICEKAVALVATLTEPWRQIRTQSSPNLVTDTLWLNQIARSKAPTIINSWNQRLRRFIRQFNIIVTDSDYQECAQSNLNSLDNVKKYVQIGKPWHFTTHQFRRSLAFYTIKHRLGSTIALKQQFKHLYLQMTEWYTEGGIASRLQDMELDSELQALLDETKVQDTTQKFFDWMHTDKPLAGAHGKAIIAMRDNVPHIYSSWDVIYNAVKKGQLTLHCTMHSYCKNGYNCDMDGVTNPAFCVDCSSGSSIIDEDNAKWWKQKHIALTAYLADKADVSPSVYSHCITQIRAAEIVMKDFGIEHETYHHPIEVVEL